MILKHNPDTVGELINTSHHDSFSYWCFLSHFFLLSRLPTEAKLEVSDQRRMLPSGLDWANILLFRHSPPHWPPTMMQGPESALGTAASHLEKQNELGMGWGSRRFSRRLCSSYPSPWSMVDAGLWIVWGKAATTTAIIQGTKLPGAGQSTLLAPWQGQRHSLPSPAL